VSRKLEKLDKYLLWAVCITIVADIAINYITSYGHLYVEGLNYGEFGVDARLMPIGIDLTLTALAVANVFATRFQRNHWLLRASLMFGVGGTVAANAAYGAGWGMTGGLLATWSPVALFITVEAGLFMFRVTADIVAEAVKAAEAEAATKRGRPVGSKNKPKPEAETVTEAPGGQLALPPVIKGTVNTADPFHELRKTGQFPTVTE
jgi:hypothetical protein